MTFRSVKFVMSGAQYTCFSRRCARCLLHRCTGAVRSAKVSSVSVSPSPFVRIVFAIRSSSFTVSGQPSSRRPLSPSNCSTICFAIRPASDRTLSTPCCSSHSVMASSCGGQVNRLRPVLVSLRERPPLRANNDVLEVRIHRGPSWICDVQWQDAGDALAPEWPETHGVHPPYVLSAVGRCELWR